MTSKKLNIISTIEEMLNNVGKTVYLLEIDNTIVASVRKTDLNKHMEECDVINDILDSADYSMLYALIVDPKRLPVDTKHLIGECPLNIWILFNDSGYIEMEEVPDMLGAVNHITECIESNIADIDDFIVLIGFRLHLISQVGKHNHPVLSMDLIRSENDNL